MRRVAVCWALICALCCATLVSHVQASDAASVSFGEALKSSFASLDSSPFEEPGYSGDTTTAPEFLKQLFNDLLASSSTGASAYASLLNATDLKQQAQSWLGALELRQVAKDAAGSTVKAPMTSAWANYTKAVTLPLLETIDSLLAAKPVLERTYFNFWNATFQRYAGYAQQIRTRLGYTATGPLTDQLVAEFRRITGTTCSAARFAPPAQANASVTGRGVTLTVNFGNCQLARAAIQVRRDFIARCVLPRTSLVITQVCRRQLTYGTESQLRVELWNPADLTDPKSDLYKLLPLSDADGNGIPNFIDKLGKYKLVREVLLSFRANISASLTQGVTKVDRLRDALAEKLKQRAWQGVRQDLSQLFPELPSWEVGVGVDKIYETVLQQGLMSTLYKRRGQGPLSSFFNIQFSGPGGGGQRMGQSAPSEGTTGTAGSSNAGADSEAGALPEDVFQRLADEMERLLEARAVSEELQQNPPTGRKVIKRAPAAPAPAPAGSDASDVPASTLAEAVQDVVESIGSAFIKAQQWGHGGAVHGDDDGGVEVTTD